MAVARTIAKNSLFNFFASVTDLGSSLAIGIMLARSLGTTQYGIYTYLMWFLNLAVLVVDLGMKDMLRRFIAESTGGENPGRPAGLIRIALAVRIISALLACAIIIVCSKFLARMAGDTGSQVFFIILAVLAIPNIISTAFVGIFRGFQRYEYSAYVTMGTGLLRVGLIAFFEFFGIGVRDVLVINMFAWVSGIAIGLFLLPRVISFKDILRPLPLDSVTRKRAIRYAAVMFGIIIVDYLAYDQAEVFFVGLFCTIDQVGFYRIALQAATMAIAVVPTAFNAVLMPAISEQFGRGDMAKIKQIFLLSERYLMMISLPIAAGMIALAMPIVTTLYGPKYDPAAVIVQILILPMAIFSIAGAGGAVIYGMDRPGFILAVNIPAACLSIGLSALLISRFGIMGAPLGKSIALLFNAVCVVVFATKKTGNSWPVRDTLMIALASAIMGVIVYFVSAALKPIVGLAVGVALGVILYVIMVLAFGVVREGDVGIFRRLEPSLPHFLRGFYGLLLDMVQRVTTKRGLSPNGET
jgi:O-antigen/teichoic acid export membrane protein